MSATRRTARAAAAALLLASGAGAAAGDPQLGAATVEHRQAADPAPLLAGLGAGAPEWLAWDVAGRPEAAGLCCWASGWHQRVCRLAGEDEGWGSSDDGTPSAAAGPLLLLIEVDQGRPRRLRAIGSTCAVDAGGRRVVRLDGVDPERSLALLDRLARVGEEELASRALAAMALHDAGDADRRLEALARDPALPASRRRDAIFWAGNARGAAGLALLERLLERERDADLRQQAYFAISQNRAPGAVERLRRAAREEGEPELRGQALFWLAQTGDPRAGGWILEQLAREQDERAQDGAVFALSQLPDSAPLLTRLLRETASARVRHQALFWLAQSDDPRALTEIEKILAAP